MLLNNDFPTGTYTPLVHAYAGHTQKQYRKTQALLSFPMPQALAFIKNCTLRQLFNLVGFPCNDFSMVGEQKRRTYFKF